jgi:F-type H+-transporting ATPase subunit gamma
VQAAAQAAMKAFEEKQFDVVEVVYSEFKNAATQRLLLKDFYQFRK